MPRSSVNDVMREMMAALAKWYSDTNGSLTSAGTASAFTLTTNAADAALSDTSLLVFRAHVANNAAPTLNRDGLGAKTVKTSAGGDLPANAWAANQVVVVARNATDDTYNLVSASGTRLIGEVVDYTGPSAPAGWILAFGQAVSRTTYAAYFALVGTTYGAGDGSTTFNVPDLRGRVVAGRDDMGGTSAGRLTSFSGALGGSGGAQTVTLTEEQLPNFTVLFGQDSAGGSFLNRVARVTSTGTSLGQGDAQDIGIPNLNNNPVSVVQPTMFLNKIIYTGV